MEGRREGRKERGGERGVGKKGSVERQGETGRRRERANNCKAAEWEQLGGVSSIARGFLLTHCRDEVIVTEASVIKVSFRPIKSIRSM